MVEVVFYRRARPSSGRLRFSVGRRVRDEAADMEDALPREPETGQMIADAQCIADPGVGIPVGMKMLHWLLSFFGHEEAECRPEDEAVAEVAG